MLATEITAVIYQGNAFDAVATMRVSRALAVYGLGLVFFGYQKSLIPWFQAQGDMRTPLRVSVLCVILNGVLNVAAVVALPVEWRHVGLAASTDVCAAFGCWLLTVRAWRKNGELGLRAILPTLGKIVLSTLVMTLVLAVVRPRLSGPYSL